MSFIVVLDDGTTYSEVDGAKIYDTGELTSAEDIEAALGEDGLRLVQALSSDFMDLEGTPAIRETLRQVIDRGYTIEQIKGMCASADWALPESLNRDKIGTVVNELVSMVQNWVEYPEGRAEGDGGGD